jgi:hypothetical protein
MVVAPTQAHPMCGATHSFARAHVALDGPSISLQPRQQQTTLNSSAPDHHVGCTCRNSRNQYPNAISTYLNTVEHMTSKSRGFKGYALQVDPVDPALTFFPLNRVTLLFMNWNDLPCQHMCAGSLLDDLGIIFIMRTSELQHAPTTICHTSST